MQITRRRRNTVRRPRDSTSDGGRMPLLERLILHPPSELLQNLPATTSDQRIRHSMSQRFRLEWRRAYPRLGVFDVLHARERSDTGV